MTEEKKYRVHDLVKFDYSEIGEYTGEGHTDTPLRNDEIVDLLNENERLKKIIENHIQRYLSLKNACNNCMMKSEQLKQDNNILIKLLENQSIIIQELHSKILEYQLKEPIVLTKEDLEIMGKAISYYTHGRCPE